MGYSIVDLTHNGGRRGGEVIADPEPGVLHPAVPPDEDQAALRAAIRPDCLALCTIVGIDGSFSRRTGAQLAVLADGSTVGSLSDGCLEQELASRARAGQGKPPQMLRYGQGSPFIDFRLPCGSGLDILVDCAPDRAALGAVIAALDRRQAASLPLPAGAASLLPARPYKPSLHLVICGSGPELTWLDRLASGYGVRCTPCGPQQGLSMGTVPGDIALDAWTAVVLLFHDHEWELPLLDWALGSPAFLIGAIGGQIARDSRRSGLARRGWSADRIERIRSPIGLIAQTRDARALALSILAEVVGAYEALRP